jgi:hypothetical protein
MGEEVMFDPTSTTVRVPLPTEFDIQKLVPGFFQLKPIDIDAAIQEKLIQAMVELQKNEDKLSDYQPKPVEPLLNQDQDEEEKDDEVLVREYFKMKIR